MRQLIGVLLASLCCGVASAQTPASAPPSSAPQIKIGGTLFADFTETLAPTAEDAAGQRYRPNAMNLTRAYVTVTGAFNPVFSFRITSDIARQISPGSSLDGSNLLRLKYAYAQLSLDRWSGRFKETWIRVGLAPTPFVENRDAVYRYRWQSPLMPERHRLISSSDVGIAFHTDLPDGYGDVQVSLVNGEGYQHPEVNGQKSLQGRVTVRPLVKSRSALLRGLRATAFYDFDHYVRHADRKRGFYGFLYENGHVNTGAEIVRSRDQVLPTAPLVHGTGWDVFATPFFKEKGHGPEALLRFDHWTPDDTKPDLEERVVLGLSYWWTQRPAGATAALMLDYESVTIRNASIPQPAERKLTLHTVLTF